MIVNRANSLEIRRLKLLISKKYKNNSFTANQS